MNKVLVGAALVVGADEAVGTKDGTALGEGVGVHGWHMALLVACSCIHPVPENIPLVSANSLR